MPSLDKQLRTHLERTVKEARDIAEAGAKAALELLGVGDAGAPSYLNDDQRNLRRRLRIHGRQLGDAFLSSASETAGEGERRTQELGRLTEEVAYEHWHRMLFAQFLAENNLLMYPDPHSPVAVSLAECEDLAVDEGARNGWELAARFAARMLPQIFRVDSPVFELELPPERQQQLEKLISDLPVEVFTASDSLGWVYQFWQANRKEQINKSEVKIGARELPAVTQLFTEDYMVDFLLDNTLGAWWAGKREVKSFPCSVFSEESDVRQAVALPGCEWNYLRFIRTPAPPTTESLPTESLKTESLKTESLNTESLNTESLNTESLNTESLNTESLNTDYWLPASGTFDGWPKAAKDLKCLDPCMGSGHFVVAMFERLVALRMAEEKLDEATAVASVIRDNLFGLEIDPRCTQIAAFNLALAAWRRVGYCILPQMNLACSGLAPNTSRDEWFALAGGNEKLQNGMDRLFDLFEQAPVLGCLINPRADKGDLLQASYHELKPLLEQALSHETLTENFKLNTENYLEMAVTARGLAKAAEVLAGQFTLVATNVPYLGRPKQDEILKDFCDSVHPDAKADLGACFVKRCLDFCSSGGGSALVTPQNWLFQPGYKKMRKALLSSSHLSFIAKLGPKGFQTPMWDFNVMLVSLTRVHPTDTSTISGLDVSAAKDASSKSVDLLSCEIVVVAQGQQQKNPECVISLEALEASKVLKKYASCVQGLATSDDPQFTIAFWELGRINDGWEGLLGTVPSTIYFGGRERLIHWQDGNGRYFRHAHALKAEGRLGGWKSGTDARGKAGILVSQMSEMPVTLYTGEFYDHNASVIVPSDPKLLAAIWAMCSSKELGTEVRKIDQSLKPSNNVFVKVPFDLAHWQKVAAEKYPHGLPKPFSSDPTQWLFSGHPHGSDNPLHVAVARLVGYQWPRQSGSSFPDCPALGPDGLESFADKDGIVCIPPVRGEAGAADRLLNLLAAAYGRDWNTDVLSRLLSDAGYAGKSLEAWLRDGFFQQHCELFHQRPFIWHIWDGLRDGFSALVNYHKLDQKNLDALTYTYLGDWITRQSQAAASGVDGAQEKLAAAEQLKKRLELILAGEAPHDIFVRWKPLHQQPIGWDPDINDGVRLNIRPFLSVPDVKAKGAGILRVKPKIKWDKDRGKEPQRPKEDFPWFWGWDEKTTDFPGGPEFKGERFNDCHYTLARKREAVKVNQNSK